MSLHQASQRSSDSAAPSSAPPELPEDPTLPCESTAVNVGDAHGGKSQLRPSSPDRLSVPHEQGSERRSRFSSVAENAKSVVKTSWRQYGGQDVASALEEARGRARGSILGDASDILSDDEDAAGSILQQGKAAPDKQLASQTGNGRWVDSRTQNDKLIKFASAQSMNGLVRFTKNAMKNQERLVGSDILKITVLEEQWQLTSFITLPMTIIFFVIFMVFFQRHYGVFNIYLAESTFRERLGVPAQTVSNVDDLHQWMESSYFPVVWDMKSNSSGHVLVGGVLIRTARSRVKTCEDSVLDGLDCFPEGELATAGGNWFEGVRWGIANPVEGTYEEESPVYSIGGGTGGGRRLNQSLAPSYALRRRNEETRRQKRRSIAATSSHDGDNSELQEEPNRHIQQSASWRRLAAAPPQLSGFLPDPYPDEADEQTLFLPRSLSLEQVKEVLQDLRTNGVFERSTTMFGLEAMVYNNEFEHALLTQIWSTFVLSRGGSLWSEFDLATLVLDFSLATTIVGVIWVLGVLSLVATVLVNAWQALHRDKLWSHLRRFWVVLEIVISLYGIVIAVLLIIEMIGSRDFVDSHDSYVRETQQSPLYMETSFTSSDGQGDARSIDTRWFLKIRDDLQGTAGASTVLQVLIASYHIVLLVRFVLASRGQPRLAMIVNTMRRAMVDLAHLLCVMCIIFAAYVSSGHILFGSRVQAYATLQGALADCVRIVLVREYSWEELTEWDYWTVTVWVWSFLLLVVVVMLNIVLAMLFETYGELREGLSGDSTIWQSVASLSTVFWNLRDWVPAGTLLQGLTELEGPKKRPKMLSPADLTKAFPEMLEVQVDYLFEQARTHVDAAVRTTTNALPEAASCLLLGVQGLTKQVQDMKEDCAKQRRDSGSSDASDKPPNANGTDIGHGPSRKQEPEAQDALTAGEPPENIPHWVAVALKPSIKEQVDTLAKVQLRLQHCHMRAHALGGITDSEVFPVEAPEKPKWPSTAPPAVVDSGDPRKVLPSSKRLGKHAAHLDMNWKLPTDFVLADVPSLKKPSGPRSQEESQTIPPESVAGAAQVAAQHLGPGVGGVSRPPPVANVPRPRPPMPLHYRMLCNVSDTVQAKPRTDHELVIAEVWDEVI